MRPTGGAHRSAAGNADLVRYTVSLFLAVVAEWAIFMGALVYAYERDGDAAVGFASLAMLGTYVVFAPFAGSLAERYRPQRVRTIGLIGQVVGYGVAAMAAYAELATGFVVVACMAGVAGVTVLRPAGAVLLPAIVRSTRQLTIANLWAGYCESTSVLIGPLLATGLLIVGGPSAVLAGCAGAAVIAVVVSTVPRPADPPGGSGSGVAVGAIASIRSSIVDLRARPGLRGLVLVDGGQYVLVGAIDIVVVVIAEERLGLGESGPAVLLTLFGVGAFVSGIVSTALVRRPELAPSIAASMIVIAIAAVVFGISLTWVAAVVALPLLGLARSVLDLLARVLLQRSAPPESLGSVFSVLELSNGLGLVVGSILAQLLIAASGPQAAMYGIAAFFTILLLATRRSLGSADAEADVPVVAMSVLRRLPIFQPLPIATLETVARAADEVDVVTGETIVREGDSGDRFYAVASGRFDVSIDGRHRSTIEAGGGFGEIALLADVPRTATIVAATSGVLFVLERDDFLLTVTGHIGSRQAAWGAVRAMDALGVAIPDDIAG